ncbi:MAG: protein kinase, partial [Thermoanaerobaculales bacterium]
MAFKFEQLEGKYEILDKIREGGMGSVYKVRHRLLDEVRVIKVMRPHLADDEVLQARFLREAKVAVKLRHANLAQIHDFTMDDSGYAFLVMEFIDGLNLQEVSKVLEKPSLGLGLEVAHQSLDALGYLHRKRIIHRDVSPDNLLITRDDEGVILVKLIDLGIAKVHGGNENLTSAGTFLGKVRYSSPEHFQTQEGSAVDARSDLYSFGVVLYEFLTGVYPIAGTNISSLIAGHMMNPPLEFSESDPQNRVPQELREVILQSLAKAPEDRFASAKAFQQALKPFLSEHAFEDSELQSIFDTPDQATRKFETIKPGSTQSRIDRSFGIQTTPPPNARTAGDRAFETSGTIETDEVSSDGGGTSNGDRQSQIRAFIVGAERLKESHHYSEARLQLASVLDLDPGNADAVKLLEAIDAADVKLQKRRAAAAEALRGLIAAGELEKATAKLEKTVKDFGAAEVFDQVRDELDASRIEQAERLDRARKLDAAASELEAEERWEDALPMLQEALKLDPANKDLEARRAAAERGADARAAARRRAQEIEETAATITGHIENSDADEAERALKLARKLYGEEEVFTELAGHIDELRDRLQREHAARLRSEAKEQITATDFANAIETLEQAHDLAPGDQETVDLLGAAREGLRLQEEARRRQSAIDATALSVERLILAGRLESAYHIIDESVADLSPFDEAETLRQTVEAEVSAMVDRRNRAKAAAERALAFAEKNAFAEASEALSEARELEKDYPELAELVNAAEADIQRLIEAHRLSMAIEKVGQSIDKHLAKGALDEARREIKVAERLYGGQAIIEELTSRIEERERELRRKEAEKLINKALRKQRKFEDVIVDLEAALELDPGNEKILRVIEETRTAHQRVLDEDRARKIGNVLDEIDRLIAAGDTAGALSAVDAAALEIGE